MSTDLSDPLQRFVRRVEQLLHEAEATAAAEASFLPHIGDQMRQLVADDAWLAAPFAQPHPQHYQQYLLHADPQERFSVVSFVWGPGQFTPIHDHTVWGVIGMLRGEELAQDYRLEANERPVPSGKGHRLLPGDVAFVSPTLGDVHQVRNAFDDRVSISIHAYGGNIGRIRRHVFAPEGGPRKPFVSGYAQPFTPAG